MFNPIIAHDGLDATLPAPLEKIKATLEAGASNEDPIGELLLNSRLGKVASVSSGIVEKIRHEVLMRTVVGEIAESAAEPEEGDADASWNILLGKSASPDARLAGPQRREDVFRKPQVAEGEPEQHADGTFVEQRGDDIETLTYKNGKLVAGRIVGPGLTGDNETFCFAGDNADEIDIDEYERLSAA